MIPIQLTIEGLYSYQERQKIDFKNLTEAGLFGIFGAVGSGKSSILEAISFALYGKTERLNANDKRAYNMMNLKSSKSYIEFDFMNYERKKFRATREFRRNSKNFDDVKIPNVMFYEWNNMSWVPIKHINAEQIIGLSYINFKRTMIIPQGQFKEFLELGAKDRTEMMKEIFNLQRFDLHHNVSLLHTENKSKLDQLEGQLKGFEEVSKEQILAQKEQLKLQNIQYEEKQKVFNKIQEHYQNLKKLKNDFESLNQKKAEFEKLHSQKAEIDHLEQKAEIYDHTFRVFSPLLSTKEKLGNEISNQLKNKDSQVEILKKIEKEFESVNKNIAELQPAFEKLNETKAQENDVSIILQMLTFSEEIEALKDRTKKGHKKVQEVEDGQKSIQNRIDFLNKDLAHVKPQKLDSGLLLKVGNWFLEKNTLAESLDKQTNKKQEKEAEINRISDELNTLEITIETFKNDIKIETETLDDHRKNLFEKQNQLKVQQQLAHFADALHEGTSCPLCGALEHPNIVEFDDVHSELKAIQQKIEENEKQKGNLQKRASKIEKIIERKTIFEEQLKAETEALDDIQKKNKEHLTNFSWSEFNANNEKDFQEKQKASLAIEQQIEEITQSIQSEQKRVEKERKTLEKYQKALEVLKLDEAKKEEQIKTNEKNLKLLKWSDYKEKSYFETESLYQSLLKSNLETEENYQNLNRKKQDISPKLAEQNSIVAHLKARIVELEKENIDNEERIKKALSEQEFNTLHGIQQILAQEMNVQEARTKIQNFRIQLETLKNSIAEYEERLKGFSYHEEKFLALENQFKIIDYDLKTVNNSIIKMKTEIERLEREFQKKEHLLKDLSQVQRRADTLKIMTNLFRGDGFVQYVSSMYLRQLCDHANVRFHRMTKNQLSLQLNENNDFEIIDYLNEGRSRSVKTLSGGQAFQVSLSLALALAECVQTNAQSDKNFFFIDEGFGTQDSESVNIVFETLMNLQKENRIVGIISHIEELKEKIPKALNITKDEDRGSLIEIV